jgi:hypothetical protein
MGSRNAPSRTRKKRAPEKVCALAEWGRNQRHGWITRLQHATKLGYPTVFRAAHGIKVRYGTAVKISNATGGAVPIEALTDERVDAEVA